ncbi:MAG: hypothetical protein RSA52_00935 [Acetivibrio sp.]
MGLNLNMNAMNQVVKGVVIYEEKEPVDSICLILKGRVSVQRKGMCTLLGSGNFLGITDIYSGNHSVSYLAYDNTVVYPFPIKESHDIAGILGANKEYGGLMVASLSRYIRDLYVILMALLTESDQLYVFLKNYYELYQLEAIKEKITINAIRGIEELGEYEKSTVLDIHKADYYKECANIPIDIQKAFYQTETVCLYHIEEQTELARQLILECSEITAYLYTGLKYLFSEGEDCLFKRTAKLIMEMNRKEMKQNRELTDAVDRMVEKINDIDMLFEKKAGQQLDINRDELENLYYIILSGEVPAEEIGSSVREKIVSLENTLETILLTSVLPNEKQEEFKELMNTYREMKDKTAVDDVSRRLRKNISKLYYEIYREVFLKTYNEETPSLSIDLFLKYGLLDETLLREEQIEELVSLEEKTENNGMCKVYNMKQWLTLIYTGKKLPSKSEFDLDYEEYIRSLRKTNEITEEEGKRRLLDMDARLNYEIHNMFEYNNRLVSGQISTFLPFLQEDNFIGGIQKARVSGKLINEAMNQLKAIDYSVFMREVMYENAELDIKREYVVKEVCPDIILFPVAGENAIMWQEISGRRRDTKGRFLLPSFTSKKIEDILVKVLGRYHWEICRTIQGAMWNNIKYKSLTSEYMDYIQFYRKNRDLSEERKEKLKGQIQKSRNNSREVFTMDYEAWIKNESQGAIRLNKVVREIMAVYCPFAVDIRENIKNQPIFSEAMVRFNIEKAAKVRILELRIHAIEKEGKEVPKEILETFQYYKEQ